MKTSITKRLMAACLMSIMVPCGAFATMYVDHFNAPASATPQAINQIGAGTSGSYRNNAQLGGTAPGVETLTGTRYLRVTKDLIVPPGGPHDASVNTFAYPSSLVDNRDVNITGDTYVVWDGNTNPQLTTPPAFPLAPPISYTAPPVDLTEGGKATGIIISILFNDMPGNIWLNFGDGTNNQTVTTFVGQHLTPVNISIPMSAWGTVDFTQLRGGYLDIQGVDARDIQIDFISNSVPEPSTFILLGVGVIGAVAMRRRARK